MRGHEYFRRQAAKSREMAKDCDEQTAQSLVMLAEDYEAEPSRLEQPLQTPGGNSLGEK
jgi:hypothetical protein